jgi:hypothetical protein
MTELPDNVRALHRAGLAEGAIMDRLSERYIGRPFPYRQGIALLVEPERVHSMELPFAHAKRVRAKPDQARPDAGLAVRPPSGRPAELTPPQRALA